MRFLLGLVVAGALTFAGPSARADGDLPRPVSEKRFYGWQNFVVGYGGGILAVRGVFAGNVLMAGTGAVIWSFGGAVVHGAHHNPAAAIASPFIMIGVPYLLYRAGDGPSHRSRDNALELAALGALVAPIADGLLGWERVERPSGIAIAPEIGRERVGLTVLGAF